MEHRVRLQSVLIPHMDICKEEQVFYHRHEEMVDFDGYFNLFYIEKRKKYTSIEGIELSIDISGYEKIELMHDRDIIESLPLKNEFAHYDFDVCQVSCQ